MHLQVSPKWIAVFMPILALGTGLPLAHGQLVAVESGTGNLYSVSESDASLSLIDSTGLSNLGALEFDPFSGMLYGLTTGEQNATLYRLDISPGLDDVVAHAIGELGIPVREGGLAFAPNGTAYGVNGGTTISVLFSVDLVTGAATTIGEIGGRHDIAGLGFRDDGVLVGLDSTDNSLLAIDTVTGAGTLMDAIGPAIGSVGGMAISGENRYFATAGLEPPETNPGTNGLYVFDPYAREDPILVGSFGDTITGVGISGLAYIPEPTTVGLLLIGGAALLRRRPRTR